MATESLHLLDLKQLRVIANPLRQKILGILCHRALSATRIAELLPDPPANLHYHLRRLEDVGLVELVEKRQVRGAVEKFYRAVASSFSVPPSTLEALGGTADRALMPSIRSQVEETLRGVAHDLRTQDEPPLVSFQRLRLSPDAASRLRDRLEEWLRDAASESDGCAKPEDSGAECGEWLLFASLVRSAEEGA